MERFFRENEQASSDFRSAGVHSGMRLGQKKSLLAKGRQEPCKEIHETIGDELLNCKPSLRTRGVAQGRTCT